MNNKPSKKFINDWSIKQAKATTTQSIAKVIALKNPSVKPFVSADEILGVNPATRIKTQYDPDPMDSKTIIFAKKMLELKATVSTDIVLLMVKRMIDERANERAAHFILIDNSGDAIYSHKKSLPMNGDIKRLEHARNDSVDLFPDFFEKI